MTRIQPKKFSTFAILLLIFFIHLFIRSHNITALPLFVDEGNHIRRAATVYDFEQHPAVESHGKFLFYFVPGIFDLKQNDTAFFLSRLSVALSSMLTLAVIFIITRRLFDERAALIAAAFYAFLPFAFFFERMALSDPWAGFIATVLVWQSIRFAAKPTYQRAMWVGVFLALTPAAKLTMAFVDFMPLLAVALFSYYTSFKEMMVRYFPHGLRALLVMAGLWALVIVPAIIQYYQGVDYALYDTWLVNTTTKADTFMGKLDDAWEKMALLVSLPITLLLLIQTGLGLTLKKYRRQMLLVVLWLVLAWLTTFFLVGRNSFQSRYMTAGTPAVAVLFGAGSLILADRLIQQPRRALYAAASVVVVWAALFAIPFAQKAASDPVQLKMPWLDRQNYFEGSFTGYALLDAMRYVQDNGDPYEGQVQAVLGTRFCIPPLYEFPRLHYDCDKSFDLTNPARRSTIPFILARLLNDIPVYLITEGDLHEPNERWFVRTEWLARFDKPHGDGFVTVWRLHLPEARPVRGVLP